MPNEMPLSASSYELKENKFVRNSPDKTLNYIANKVDEEIFVVDTYNRVISLAYKLTRNEAIYFVYSFFC